MRISEIVDVPVLDSRGFPVDWEPASVVAERVGRLQIAVEGVDVTYWGGVACPVPSWARGEPFGSQWARVVVPGVSPFQALPSWVREGSRVVVRLVRESGDPEDLFVGFVNSWSPHGAQDDFSLSCLGVLFASDKELRLPDFSASVNDMGLLIAAILNDARNRGSRWQPMAPVVTGLTSSTAGAWQPKLTGFVQDLLATMLAPDGQQWTVACETDQPSLVLKDLETVAWTVRLGQRGVDPDLEHLIPSNVFYGEGQAPDGGRWRNAAFPGWHPEESPAYPGPLSTGITIGWTDARTTSGMGVSDWQQRVGQPVTGVFSAADRAATRRIQTAAGIKVDGVLGPQTWATSFEIGANVGSLDAVILPLAAATQVEPELRGARGQVLGTNPAYAADVLRVEEFTAFGQGVEKSEARATAQAMLQRSLSHQPGYAGTLTLEADPREGSRLLIREGENLRLLGLHGSDVVLHVVSVEHEEAESRLTVDTHARDYPTLAAVRERERNAVDPAKSFIQRRTAGSLVSDRPSFDAESPAGTIPRLALFRNLWTVIPVPAGSYGTFARSELTTSSPVTPFAVSVWDRPITAARLLQLVGNPLTAESNPWAVDLAAEGLLMSWGWAKQPAGYYPGSFSDTEGETTAPVTGRLVDDASWTYASTRSPWLWVGIIASQSCWVEGRLYPGADW